MKANINKLSNRISRNSFLRAVTLGLPLLPALALKAQTSDPSHQAIAPQSGAPDLGNLRAFVELARSDIKTEKALIIAQNIDFTHDEAIDFWPLHQEYELELNKLLDQRYDLILKFASQYGTMT